jgi:hypothetical protein
VGSAFQAAAGLRPGPDADWKVGGRLKARPHFASVVLFWGCRVRGPVAQLGARFHGMEEVVSSNLTRSTISLSCPFEEPARTAPRNAG